MLKEGRDIATWAENVIVKCPLTPAGLAATRALSKDDIKVNVTLCFSVNQAILAAQAGAWCVSPFVGRLDDINEDGCALVEHIVEVFHIQGFETKVLAASLRGPQHITRCALAAPTSPRCRTRSSSNWLLILSLTQGWRNFSKIGKQSRTTRLPRLRCGAAPVNFGYFK